MCGHFTGLRESRSSQTRSCEGANGGVEATPTASAPKPSTELACMESTEGFAEAPRVGDFQRKAIADV